MAFEEQGFCVVRGPDLLWGGDVKRFHPTAGRFDGVIGGPPCQAFSTLANLVRAKGYEPRYGNLIPEFERCIYHAHPIWFLMENVRRAPNPAPLGYAVEAFELDNVWFGEEQKRRRKFWFGVRGATAVDLRPYLDGFAALELPVQSAAVYQRGIDKSAEAKGRVQTQAVTADRRAVPVAIGGSGKRKVTAQVPAVTDANAGSHRPKGGHLITYSIPEMCRLQGLPEDFLAEAPFTAQGKRKVLGNGVPLPMGRAVAEAVTRALEAGP